MDAKEKDVIRVAQEIERYVSSHPHAADTLDGIVKWWLMRQRMEEGKMLVNAALEYLVKQDLLKKSIGTNGTPIYSKGGVGEGGEGEWNH